MRGYKVLSFLGFITQLAPNMSKQTKEKKKDNTDDDDKHELNTLRASLEN